MGCNVGNIFALDILQHMMILSFLQDIPRENIRFGLIERFSLPLFLVFIDSIRKILFRGMSLSFDFFPKMSYFYNMR